MPFTPQTAILLGLLWLAFFSAHSVLAALSAKELVAARRPGLMPYYRAAYVLASVALVVPPIWLSGSLDAPWLWRWEGGLWWLSTGLAAVAVLGIVWTGAHYDLAEHFGLRQIRERTMTVEDQETFKLSPIHRFVRHPWYFFLLVIIWSRDVDGARLIAYAAITGYLIVGSRLEDRKLVSYYGDTYRRYIERVPGLIPLPWRALSRRQAGELVRSYERSRALRHLDEAVRPPLGEAGVPEDPAVSRPTAGSGAPRASG